MNQNEVSELFECVGEIWRDITAIEFLMRAGIARKDGEIEKFPKPPYFKWKTYQDSHDSFWYYNFEIIANKFNKRYPSVKIPNELIELRNAMAHGMISSTWDNPFETLVKFRSKKDCASLEAEFHWI